MEPQKRYPENLSDSPALTSDIPAVQEKHWAIVDAELFQPGTCSGNTTQISRMCWRIPFPPFVTKAHCLKEGSLLFKCLLSFLPQRRTHFSQLLISGRSSVFLLSDVFEVIFKF